jgi:rhodanese-related sulfurtransferase
LSAAPEPAFGELRFRGNDPRLHRLPNDKTIVTVCASGRRSAAAARTLQRAGYQAENLKGGMRSWSRAGLPLRSARSTPR